LRVANHAAPLLSLEAGVLELQDTPHSRLYCRRCAVLRTGPHVRAEAGRGTLESSAQITVAELPARFKHDLSRPPRPPVTDSTDLSFPTTYSASNV